MPEEITNLELKNRVKDGIDALTINVQNYVGLAQKKYDLLHSTADELSDLRHRLVTIIGSLNYIGAYDFNKATPTQSELTDYVTNSYKIALKKGDTIINLFNSVE